MDPDQPAGSPHGSSSSRRRHPGAVGGPRHATGPLQSQERVASTSPSVRHPRRPSAAPRRAPVRDHWRGGPPPAVLTPPRLPPGPTRHDPGGDPGPAGGGGGGGGGAAKPPAPR